MSKKPFAEEIKKLAAAKKVAKPSGDSTRSAPGKASPAEEPEFEFEKLSAIRAKPVKWLIPGRIPLGKVTLIAADGGSGKSTLTRHIAAAITTARPAFGLGYQPQSPGDVVMCAAEDSFEEVVVPHFIAEGGDLDRVARVHHVHTEPDGRKSKVHLSADHLPMLRLELAKWPDVRLIVIDPIASFIGRSRIDDHKQSELRQILDPLSDLADQTGTAIIVVAHLNKSTAVKAVHKIAGSVGYAAAVRLAYVIGIDEGDSTRRLLMPVKSNLLGVVRDAAAFRLELLSGIDLDGYRNHPCLEDLSDEDFAEVGEQMARVRFDANVAANAEEVMGERKRGRDANKVGKCVEWLKIFLAEFAYPSKEIVAAASENGFTFDNQKEAKSALKKSGLQNSNHGRFQGEWWSGFGMPSTWKLRPDPLLTTPDSPFIPLIPNLVEL